MDGFFVEPIGTVECAGEGFFLQLRAEFAPALEGLEEFGYAQVVWWFDRCDDARSRRVLTAARPYTRGPERLGIFATRSPQRPNPIALSAAQVRGVDRQAGRVQLAWIDAAPGTPLLDLKPYTPSMDRAEAPAVPAWCGHWPNSIEASGDFDWAAEFNF